MRNKPYSKGATLSLYISLWLGIILVGYLLGYDLYAQRFKKLLDNPISGTFDLLTNAFSDWRFLVLVFGTTLAAGGFASYLTGGGFSLLYIIPMAMILTFMEIFIIPTDIILKSTIPDEIKIIYSAFIGGLTILTIIAFTGGRQ